MKIPGFTAEAALGVKQDRYALAVGRTAENGLLVPQQSWTSDWCPRGTCLHCNQFGCSCGSCLIRSHI
jgi:hypothetical protein